MKMRFPTRSGVVLTIAAMLAPVALAQPVLRGSEITEDRLIDALTPGPDEVRTRSIRVEREAPTAKKGAASLLITFETNSARLSSAAERSLDVVARALQADRLAAFNFSVEGHADPRGGADYNLRLSQARAESVVDYLVSQGIDPARFIVEAVLPPEERRGTDDPNLQAQDRFVELTLVTAGR